MILCIDQMPKSAYKICARSAAWTAVTRVSHGRPKYYQRFQIGQLTKADTINYNN